MKRRKNDIKSYIIGGISTGSRVSSGITEEDYLEIEREGQKQRQKIDEECVREGRKLLRPGKERSRKLGVIGHKEVKITDEVFNESLRRLGLQKRRERERPYTNNERWILKLFDTNKELVATDIARVLRLPRTTVNGALQSLETMGVLQSRRDTVKRDGVMTRVRVYSRLTARTSTSR